MIVDMTAAEFAALVRTRDCVILPVAIGGRIYAVVKGSEDENIYRAAVA